MGVDADLENKDGRLGQLEILKAQECQGSDLGHASAEEWA